MKMWAGRFSKELNSEINSFNSSIGFDHVMYKQDIAGSLVHAEMLEKCKIISQNDLCSIQKGLYSILEDIENGNLSVDPTAEDIHMFIEAELTSRIGDAGKRLHTARSRNDQVALDTKMYLMSKWDTVGQLLISLVKQLCSTASEHCDTVMPGYTHLQRAQPITFGHHLMAYASMFMRDIERLWQCMERIGAENPLGSGALAGTTYPIDRHFTSEKMGFAVPYSNSLDGVSDRDYCIELASVCSIIMMHLSRFSEEIILWCSWEFKFVELDDSFATGSSIMPQKKNPDIAELVRGKTGRVYGSLVTLLTVMKGLPLAYNKDMQEDKEAIFDVLNTVELCLSSFIPMISTMTVLKNNMRNAAAKGFINATDCADYLTKKGLPFRTAYQITGELVALCISQNNTLENLDMSEYKKKSDLFDEDIYDAISLEKCVADRLSYGGPSPTSVKKQIDLIQNTLSKYRIPY